MSTSAIYQSQPKAEPPPPPTHEENKTKSTVKTPNPTQFLILPRDIETKFLDAHKK